MRISPSPPQRIMTCAQPASSLPNKCSGKTSRPNASPMGLPCAGAVLPRLPAGGGPRGGAPQPHGPARGVPGVAADDPAAGVPAGQPPILAHHVPEWPRPPCGSVGACGRLSSSSTASAPRPSPPPWSSPHSPPRSSWSTRRAGISTASGPIWTSCMKCHPPSRCVHLFSCLHSLLGRGFGMLKVFLKAPPLYGAQL